jgi:hypothetical protein
MLEEEGEQRDWTDEELDLIVSDYFLMLNDEAAGVPFNKAQHNLLLRNKVDRSKGSIEFQTSKYFGSASTARASLDKGISARSKLSKSDHSRDRQLPLTEPSRPASREKR